MAKKKKDPWGIEEELVKKEATKSVKKGVAKSIQKELDKKKGRRQMKIYYETHRRLKYLALDADMSIIDYIGQLVDEKWDKRKG